MNFKRWCYVAERLSIESRQTFVWGWLRLGLGIAQLTLVFAAVGLLLLIGLHFVTWIAVVTATLLTILSRLLYGGRKRPPQQIK